VKINLTLKIWRQSGPNKKGEFKTYPSGPISTDISFLEMLDILNDRLTREGEEPVACVPWGWTTRRLTTMPGCAATP